MLLFLNCFSAGASFLLGFLLFFHPLHQNMRANRWLAAFVFIAGTSFINSWLMSSGYDNDSLFLSRILKSIQFLSAPVLYISILNFVNPVQRFKSKYLFHFFPFIVYAFADVCFGKGPGGVFSLVLFPVNQDISFLVRDTLPFLLLFYLFLSALLLRRHKAGLKRITSAVAGIDLSWLSAFLFILFLTAGIWINDALFELPLLTQATSFLYVLAVFFLAWFAIRQRTVFDFGNQDIGPISEILHPEEQEPSQRPDDQQKAPEASDEYRLYDVTLSEKARSKRLEEAELAELKVRLTALMENEKPYLINDLSLPVLATMLNISIHEASFLINETTGDNFYNYINRYRVGEAKRLLAGSALDKLNILGIAFASGFNSKTAFNTAFRKWTGQSPGAYAKAQKNR